MKNPTLPLEEVDTKYLCRKLRAMIDTVEKGAFEPRTDTVGWLELELEELSEAIKKMKYSLPYGT